MKKIKKKKKTLSNHLKAVVIQAAESVQFVRAESAAGADLVIAFNVLKEHDSLIVDHPTEAGYIIFCK